jgi:hypothetical protein
MELLAIMPKILLKSTASTLNAPRSIEAKAGVIQDRMLIAMITPSEMSSRWLI